MLNYRQTLKFFYALSKMMKEFFSKLNLLFVPSTAKKDTKKRFSYYLPDAGEILFNELGKLIEFDGDKLNDDEWASVRGDAFAEQVALVPKLCTVLL